MGMMHEGYFVGRKELGNWIAQCFDPSFKKVEDLASGVVYCQILNSVHPGAIQMGKVKMQAKTEVDFIHNFKLLQNGFTKKKIDRYIDVDKLTKRSFQFNMEFLQFMKTYWDMHSPDANSSENVFKEPNAPAPAPPRKAPAVSGPPSAAPPPSGPRRVERPAEAKADGPAPASAAGSISSRAHAELQSEVTDLKISVDNLERERDFYYNKLREVEVLCQAHEGEQTPFLQEVLAILYKPDDNEEFAAPEEEVPQ